MKLDQNIPQLMLPRSTHGNVPVPLKSMMLGRRICLCYQSVHSYDVNTLHCLLNRFIGRYRQHLAHINDSIYIKALSCVCDSDV